MAGSKALINIAIKRAAIASLLAIFASLLPILSPSPVVIPSAKATLADCAAAGYTSGGLTITPSHGKVLYIDTGVSPKIDAAYIGYRITNNGASAISGYWVNLGNFRGGVVGLANVRDADQQLVDSSSPLPEVAAGASKTVYFLVKANTSTQVRQTHAVKVFPGRPDQAGISATAECDFSFTKVSETIKAAANKVTSVSVVTTGSLTTGQLITIEVRGAAGVVGAGSPDIGRIMWFSPAAFSSFPTSALRLESVQLVTSPDNANWNNSTDIRIYNERLLVTPSINPESSASSLLTYTGYTGVYSELLTSTDSLTAKRYYKNVYRFRVIGKSTTAAQISPVSQISSGTQIKHTDLANSSSATISTNTVSTPITITKGLSTGSFYVGTGSYVNYVRASYRVTVATTAASGIELAVEDVVDTPPSGAVYAGSASYRIGSGSTIQIVPVRLSTESSLSPQPYHFIGPFRITSTSSLTIDYQMYIPIATGTYTNTVKGVIGEQIIATATGFELPGVFITTDGSGVTSTGSTTQTLNPEPVTLPADVSTGSTYLNGTVDANNQSSVVTFEYGTNSNLSTYTSVSAGSNTSTSSPVSYRYLFSGSTGTKYFFRIVATAGGTRYAGDILDFTTYEPPSAPTAVTNIPLSVGSTIATIAGQVDPNLNTMSEIRFRVSTSSTSSSVTSGSSALTYSTLATGSTFVLKDLDELGNIVGNTSASGSSPTDFSYDLTGLTANTTYYYQIEAVYPDGTVVGGVRSFKTGTVGQSITLSVGSNVYISDASKTVTGTATSGSAVTFNSENTSICTVNSSSGLVTYVTVGTCSITASQDGGGSFSAATPVTDSFEILPSAPTATTNAATSVGQRGGTLNGSVNVGGATSTDVTFLYSTTEAHITTGSGGTRVNASITPISSNGNSSLALTGLNPSTTYYYRIDATNSTGTAAGATVSFTTDALTARTLTLAVGSATLIYGSPTFNSTSTASLGDSEGSKSWTSSSTTVCSVNSSTGVVTIISAGDCVLSSQITSGSTYAAATSNTLTLTITPKNINVTADDKSRNSGDSEPTFTFSHSTLVGTDDIGSVTFTFQTGSSATAYGPSGTAPTAAGSYVITPSAAVFTSGSSANYNITYVTGTYTVTTLNSQTITFTTGSTQIYRTPFTVTGTASSGSAVTFTTSGDCTGSGTIAAGSTVEITPTAVGTENCTITATQGGGGTFGAANPVIRIVTILKAMLTVTATGKTVTYGTSAGSYLFTTTDWKSPDSDYQPGDTRPTCTSSYTTTVSVGSSPLTITCSGGLTSNYDFTYVAGSLVIEKADQSISFTTPDPMRVGDANQNLTYSASSGLPVTVSSNTLSICTISGAAVSAVAAGECTLTAVQGGNVNYNAATDVPKTFSITVDAGSSGGGGGGSSAPVEPIIPGPKIDSISLSEICAIGNDITITGNHFNEAKVFLDGIQVLIRVLTSTTISLQLPQAGDGNRLIRVTTPYGVDTVLIRYVDSPKPRFNPIRIPYMSEGEYLALPLSVSNALTFVLDGNLPIGLFLNSQTGVISGTPTQNGIFVFSVIARGICGESKQLIELDIDKKTPNAISHRINILTGSLCISDAARVSFETFLEKVKEIAPRNIIPEIYISGGGIGSGRELGEDRLDCVCNLLIEEEVYGSIVSGEFTGSPNRIEVIFYWARP